MKQKLIETRYNNILCIKVPKEATDFAFKLVNKGDAISYRLDGITYTQPLEGTFKGKILNTWSKLTESEARCLVDWSLIVNNPNSKIVYKNYNFTSYVRPFDTALESFESLMINNDMYLINSPNSKPSEDDFNKYPLPICFDKHEELKELNLRRDKIKKDAEEDTGEYLIMDLF